MILFLMSSIMIFPLTLTGASFISTWLGEQTRLCLTQHFSIELAGGAADAVGSQPTPVTDCVRYELAREPTIFIHQFVVSFST